MRNIASLESEVLHADQRDVVDVGGTTLNETRILAPLHALTVGAVGTMTLAVMTRASLGHSGRALTAGPGTVLIYGLVSLAALLRIAVPLAGSQMAIVTSLAGVAWMAAFALFAALYAPIFFDRKQS